MDDDQCRTMTWNTDIYHPEEIISPSNSVESFNSSNSSTIRKNKFDDRSQTKINLSLKAYLSNKFFHELPSNKFKDPEFLKSPESFFKWSKATKISNIINSSDFCTKHGKASHFEPTSIYIAIGTEKGHIIGFNYHQGIEYVAVPSAFDKLDEGKISAITFSSDSTQMAAGYENGLIIIWDLSTKSSGLIPGRIGPVYSIASITLEQRFNKNMQGHLSDSKITNIRFIGDSHSQLISTDSSGLTFFHYGIKKLFKLYFITQKLLGTNDANSNEIRYLVHDIDILPFGSSPHITDDLGVVAVLTSHGLSIISVLSLNNPHTINLRTHFKIGKSKLVASTSHFSGCLNWFPSIEQDNKKTNARLAYSWNNILTIIEIDHTLFPNNFTSIISELKDKDKAIPNLKIIKTCSWSAPERNNLIAGLKWLSSDILCVFLKKSAANPEVYMVILHYTNDSIAKLEPISFDDLQNSNIIFETQEVKNGESERELFHSFNNSIKAFKSRLMFFRNSKNELELYIGISLNWADKLLGYLSDRNYPRAIISAKNYFYSNETGKLTLVGLPRNRALRIALIEPYLLQIMKESVHCLFGSGKSNQDYFMHIYFEIISNLYKGGHSDKLADIFEILFEAIEIKSLFFSTLEPHILSGDIPTLPPIVLQKLVEYYVKMEKGDRLTEILCILDIKTLDIDLTIQLCNRYKLRDCLIYIWNFLLGDYSTPLVDFLNDIYTSQDLDECMKVYSYISFVLTGRQYPTDKLISPDDEKFAQTSITQILFSSSPMSLPNGFPNFLAQKETIFPYLSILLKFSSFEMLSTLNEFFEETMLNDNRLLNRQFIIEALLDIFEYNEFNESDYCQLAIFIARNYPKYPQFIRLSETVLNEVFEHLCSNNDPKLSQDCELALQSLLPEYEPENEAYLFEKLKAAKFYDVLIEKYRSEGNYPQMLSMWLVKHQQETSDNLQQNSLYNVLETSFECTKIQDERLNLINIIFKNFKSFLAIDTEATVKAICRYAPQLHSLILDVEDKLLGYKYLNILFGESELEKAQIDKFPVLIARYISLLCEFQNDALYAFIQNFVSELNKDIDQFKFCLDLLRANDFVDSLTILLLYNSQYEQALDELIAYMKKYCDKFHDGYKTKFSEYINLAIGICERSETYVYIDDIYLNEELWLKLMRSCIEMAHNSKSDVEVANFFNQCTHDCFIHVSDIKSNSNEQKEKAFFKIFNKFLSDSSNEIATLSSVRGILQDVFISYSYENEMLQLSLKMLNESIFKSMQLVKANNIRGWPIKNRACASCGKIMWGSSVSENHYTAWESRQKQILLMESPIAKTSEVLAHKPNDLIFFKCEHGYHLSCLEKLGYINSKECAICTPSISFNS